ncbi:MAG TPA: hypothetical protein VN862_10655 [Candidatus Acidoferrales bacterium]|nr:hypothetical protein [Candidatus Acidoferrales bacterium]
MDRLTRGRISLFLLLAFICAFSGPLLQGCGHEEHGAEGARSKVKTSLPDGVDPNRPRTLSFADLAALPDPPGVVKNDPRYQNARIPAFSNALGVSEGDAVKVGAYLHRVTYMGDGDYNLRFSASPTSTDNYIVSEIPDDDDVPRKLRPMVVAARAYLKSQILGGKQPSKQGTELNPAPYVEITGGLYFSDSHVGDPPRPDQQGLHRASSWQIHPGIDIRLATAPVSQ